MNIWLTYICPVVNWPQYEPAVRRFLDSHTRFPAEFPHEMHVVCNGGKLNAAIENLFAGQNPVFHHHDNTGWDIGAFDKIASEAACDQMVFFGANTHFRRAGWLRRMQEGWEKLGPGLYGTSASYDYSPHIRTNGFLCAPKLVRDAWARNAPRSNARHWFEVGRDSLANTAAKQDLPDVLVTWDGFFPRPEWRRPPNIYRRGDQSNCLVYDRHHEIFESCTPAQKVRLERIADGSKFEYYRSAIEVRLRRWWRRAS